MRFLALVTVAAGLAGLSGMAAGEGRTADNADAAMPSKAITEPTGVVELYTSQGCSSCPSADALLGKLAKRDDIIALSFSVDYWDYLGWKDTLANPKFTERQRAYGKARGDGAIYTPQAVINGMTHVNGSDEDQIGRLVDKTAKTLSALRVPLRLSKDKDKLVVEAGPAPSGATPKEATLWLAVISKEVAVPIERGENHGKTIIYNNVVRELIPIGMWNGKAMTVQLERHSFMQPGTDRCAVLLQQGHAGPIVGAALLRQF